MSYKVSQKKGKEIIGSICLFIFVLMGFALGMFVWTDPKGAANETSFLVFASAFILVVISMAVFLIYQGKRPRI